MIIKHCQVKYMYIHVGTDTLSVDLMVHYCLIHYPFCGDTLSDRVFLLLHYPSTGETSVGDTLSVNL